MNTKIFISIFLFLTACGGDGGGGNGNRKSNNPLIPEPGHARQVSSGGSGYTCAVLKTGKVACWGFNEHGNLGDGTRENRTTPVEVDLGEGDSAVAVYAGLATTCAILDGGSVKCWGWNRNGQVGDGTSTDQSSPVDVNLGQGVTAKMVRPGREHTCALLNDDSVVCWGRNNYGQIGDGTNTDRSNPTAVGLGQNAVVTAIYVGNNSSCAILNDKSVKCWGRNAYGQIGDDSTTGRNTPVTIAFPGEKSALSVSIGSEHACAILDDNSLACWGQNEYGQLGVNASSNEVCTVGGFDYDCVKTPTVVKLGESRSALSVSVGHGHTCALLDDNSVKCWGRNNQGQLGDGTIVNKSNPTTAVDLGGKTVAAIDAGSFSSCALFEDGHLTCWGRNEYGQLGTGEYASVLTPQKVNTGEDTVTAIDGGHGHSCGLFEDDDDGVKLKCWGWNNSGQIGSNDRMNKLNPFKHFFLNNSPAMFSTGNNHGCVILATKQIGCWGENEFGQLGNGNNTLQLETTGVNLGSNKNAVAVSAGREHTCAILNDNKIKCWGKGSQGRLGNGASTNHNTPVDVTMGGSVTAEAISAGDQHTCAIFNDDKVYCWGENAAGELGIGNNTDQNTPSVVDLGASKTATAISVGESHSCALLNDNTVKCWGYNAHGQVGDRSTTNRNAPVAVPLGSGRSATAIHAKSDHTCAILDDGSLLCWGENDRGQLGDGTTTNRDTPVAVDLGEGRTATQVGGGSSHTCAILDDESLKCWGYNYYGQTALPTAHRGDQPGEMGKNLIFVDLDIEKEGPADVHVALGKNHTCAIDEEGRLSCWGRNNDGQLGDGTTTDRGTPSVVNLGEGRTAVAVSANDQNTCAISDVGSLACWGGNTHGQLGGSSDNTTPHTVNLGEGRSAIAVGVGSWHTCALLDNDSLVCWGRNNDGQLGDGTTTNRAAPTAVTFTEGRSAIAVSTGGTHTCAILDDGSLWCWGASLGQLGVSDNYVGHPICDGVNQRCLKNPTEVDLGSRSAVAVSTGDEHTCAIYDDGSLKCWGQNTYAQLGQLGGTRGTPVDRNLGTDRSALGVSASFGHTCAILDDNSLMCWGYNEYGEVGVGNTTAQTAPAAVALEGKAVKAVEGGGSHTCVVLEDNSLRCWGRNTYGQLGNGSTIDQYRPAVSRFK